MAFIVVGWTLALQLSALAADTRMVVDSLGQKVVIPKEVTKVATLIPAFCQVTEMLTRGGGRVVAYPTAGISDYFKKVFPDLLKSNPKSYDSRSLEEVLASGAQVLYGPTALTLSDPERERLTAAGVAVVNVSGIASVEELSQSFLIIGEILGETESLRAKEFVRYYQGNVANAARLSSAISRDKRLRVLFLYGTGGAYRTINRHDISHHYLTAAGGINLGADYSLNGQALGGTIDKETIVTWDPEVIISSGPVDRAEILADPVLAEVTAVKNKRVYPSPRGIFVWYARSAEGAMMPLWLGTKLYPELFKDVHMEEVVRDYFFNFYNYRIPKEELATVLQLETSPAGKNLN
ncbi:MAG: ABC transporter substrate-binding protein [Deltaproteobacteria bacterium]|nr:ABC transporter substrate-binding protein [Deltaproteobacteria bacterium]